MLGEIFAFLDNVKWKNKWKVKNEKSVLPAIGVVG
jgi:hypothetical protein